MATAQTITAFKTFVIETETSGIMANITDSQFVTLLNQSLVNRYQELKTDAPVEYFKTATLTFATEGFEIALPTDIDPTNTTSFQLFDNAQRIGGSLLDRALWRRQGGNIRFNFSNNVGKQYFLEYAKEPGLYDSASPSDLVDETANLRSKNYLGYEIRKLFFDGLRNSEAAAAGQNQLVNANRIS